MVKDGQHNSNMASQTGRYSTIVRIFKLMGPHGKESLPWPLFSTVCCQNILSVGKGSDSRTLCIQHREDTTPAMNYSIIIN